MVMTPLMATGSAPLAAPSGSLNVFAVSEPLGGDEVRKQSFCLLCGGAGIAGAVALLCADVVDEDRQLVAALAATSVLVAIWLSAARRPLAGWVYQVLLVHGTVALGVMNVASHLGPEPFIALFLWQMFLASSFLRARETFLQLALIAAVLAAVLAKTHEGPNITIIWFSNVIALLAAAVVIHLLRVRLSLRLHKLEADATSDSLTALSNRRAFDLALPAEITAAMATGRDLSLVIADVDHFKLVNDRLGHAGGDAVLQRLASLLSGRRRGCDALFRIGGEEFALLLPGTDESGAIMLAELLRRTIESDPELRTAGVTMSFGAAMLAPAWEGPIELFRAADRALYVAKERGRNRTVSRAQAEGREDLPDDRRRPAAQPEPLSRGPLAVPQLLQSSRETRATPHVRRATGPQPHRRAPGH